MSEMTIGQINDLINEVTENLHRTYSKLMLFEHITKVANQFAKKSSIEERGKLIDLAVYASKKAKCYECILVSEGLRLAEAEVLLDEKLKKK